MLAFIKIILALLNDTLHAIAEAFRKGERKIVKGNGSCFDAKKSSLESGREMLKNLNQVMCPLFKNFIQTSLILECNDLPLRKRNKKDN